MQITESNLDAIRVGFDAVLMDAFMGVDMELLYTPKLARVRASKTRKTRVGMMARLPKMRLWDGDRAYNNITEYTHEFEAKNYENSVKVRKEEILEDNLGIFTGVLENLGAQARKHPDDLIVTLLQNGNTGLCYDGQYFFDTDHPSVKGSTGTQQNYWSSSKALTVANVAAVRAAMMAFLGDDGRPLGVRPNCIVVPPALEHTARQIAKTKFMVNTAGDTPAAGAATMENPWVGVYEVIVMPELAGADTTWYLADTSHRASPIIVVENEGIISEFLGSGSEHTFKTREFLYGVSWRGTAGYGAWFTMAKMVG